MGKGKKRKKKKVNNKLKFRWPIHKKSRDLKPTEDRDYDRIIRVQIPLVIVLSVIFALVLTVYILLQTFQIKNVEVTGNKHYTEEQIKALVMRGRFGDNSLYLSLKYSDKSITDIPFIQTMDVEVVDRNSIKISVYEKKLAGYVEYLGKYMYFDRDGVVVETSSIKTAGVPMVAGLTFDHFVKDEPLPVENEKVFNIILNITQMLNKYDIETDRIYFDSDYNMTLYFDKVRVRLGDTNLLEEKMQMLKSILPQLEGEKGLLDFTTYDSGSQNITFTRDN